MCSSELDVFPCPQPLNDNRQARCKLLQPYKVLPRCRDIDLAIVSRESRMTRTEQSWGTLEQAGCPTVSRVSREAFGTHWTRSVQLAVILRILCQQWLETTALTTCRSMVSHILCAPAATALRTLSAAFALSSAQTLRPAHRSLFMYSCHPTSCPSCRASITSSTLLLAAKLRIRRIP